jgi:hypothetical protein
MPEYLQKTLTAGGQHTYLHNIPVPSIQLFDTFTASQRGLCHPKSASPPGNEYSSYASKVPSIHPLLTLRQPHTYSLTPPLPPTYLFSPSTPATHQSHLSQYLTAPCSLFTLIQTIVDGFLPQLYPGPDDKPGESERVYMFARKFA